MNDYILFLVCQLPQCINLPTNIMNEATLLFLSSYDKTKEYLQLKCH